MISKTCRAKEKTSEYQSATATNCRKIKRDEQKTVLKSTLMQLKITNAEITALINVIESVIGDEDDGEQG